MRPEMTERQSLFPSLRAFVENDGYEVVTMSDGHPSAVPMNHDSAVRELAIAEEIVQIVKARRTRFAESYSENRTDEEGRLDELLAQVGE